MLELLLSTKKAGAGLPKSWVTLAAPPLSRYQHEVAEVGGYLYYFAGYGGSYFNALHRYDPIADTWAVMATGPTGRYGASFVAVGTKIYMFGGWTSSINAEHWVYDTVANSWAQLANGPAGRFGHSAVLVDGYIYITGGSANGSAAQGTNYRFNPADNTWVTNLAVMAIPSWYHATWVHNGRIYMFGGRAGATITNAFRYYDIASNTWTDLTGQPSERMAASAVILDGIVHIFGGSSTVAGNALSEYWLYDPVANTWTSAVTTLSKRWDHTAIVYAGVIYLNSGRSASATYLLDHHAYK